MKKRVHYPEEVKWKVVEMKKEGYFNRTIRERLGIKNVSQNIHEMVLYKSDS